MRSDLRLLGAALGLAGTAVGVRAARRRPPHAYGLHHAGVTVRDFEAAVRWWHRRFGFLLVSETTIRGRAAADLAGLYGRPDLSIRLGFLRGRDGTILEIFQFTPAEASTAVVWNRPGYTHVAVNVSDVPAWKARLEADGLHFVTPVQRTMGAHWAFFRDPDGNLVELIDLHHARAALRHLGGLVGAVAKRTAWREYYR